jgi:hypothetical protein
MPGAIQLFIGASPVRLAPVWRYLPCPDPDLRSLPVEVRGLLQHRLINQRVAVIHHGFVLYNVPPASSKIATAGAKVRSGPLFAST